ncbi:MAG: carbohydrate kinase family protein [Vicinamibacteria bacterium]|nr:carbohydrate kinase family protein [Vicinamibacteria bacterium]
MTAPDLVLLGNLLVDDVVLPDGRTRMAEAGGSVLYGALAARLWQTPVGLATVRGSDYPQPVLDALRSRGVDFEGVRELGREGLRTWLLYEGKRRQVLHRLDRPTHAEVSPTPGSLPERYQHSRAFHLGPMPFEVQRELVLELSTLPGAMLSLDPFRPLRPDTLDAWQPIFARIDMLFLSEDEMQLPGAVQRPEDVLRSLRGGRLRHVFYKRGAQGGLAYDVARDRIDAWGGRAPEYADATGAGDAFASGVISGLLRGEPTARAVARGIVGASFAISSWGIDGLLETGAEEAEGRLANWFAQGGAWAEA